LQKRSLVKIEKGTRTQDAENKITVGRIPNSSSEIISWPAGQKNILGEANNILQNIFLPIRLELVKALSKITPIKKMIDSKQRIVILIGP
jgi:hypothetical protein